MIFYNLLLIPITNKFVYLEAPEKIFYSLLVMFYDLLLILITDNLFTWKFITDILAYKSKSLHAF